jgi:hypothetical protein
MRRWTAFAAAILWVAACGSNGTPTSGVSSSSGGEGASSSPTGLNSSGLGQLPDPCSLLTMADMVAYTGATSVTLEKVDAKVCDFKPAFSAKLVRVTVKNNANNGFDTDKAHFSGTTVTGIGDAAFLALGNALIEFRKGSTVVSLQQQSAIPPGEIQQFEDLARTAAGRT